MNQEFAKGVDFVRPTDRPIDASTDRSIAFSPIDGKHRWTSQCDAGF